MNVDDECLSLSYPGGTCEDDDARWFHCMASYGINSELQEAIMDPRFRHIHLTETCKLWLQDTIHLRYRDTTPFTAEELGRVTRRLQNLALES